MKEVYNELMQMNCDPLLSKIFNEAFRKAEKKYLKLHYKTFNFLKWIKMKFFFRKVEKRISNTFQKAISDFLLYGHSEINVDEGY